MPSLPPTRYYHRSLPAAWLLFLWYLYALIWCLLWLPLCVLLVWFDSTIVALGFLYVGCVGWLTVMLLPQPLYYLPLLTPPYPLPDLPPGGSHLLPAIAFWSFSVVDWCGSGQTDSVGLLCQHCFPLYPIPFLPLPLTHLVWAFLPPPPPAPFAFAPYLPALFCLCL